ncbi:hypothetical protein CYLTODRAFT_363638 [Cylindrobasidium torrendii FP15055 ss-10]|uniref:CxC2-like cysteine cluster KDZ transposase-associated domain-containing protein n=1 Tax=Cylindrobasidium torrendii FP15055 ss-10 TaxID=1314674 RepID=A0A0D7ARL3_9AGAR|nr:hypothetical protein CYLTODRAFT_363638 [Cylindrobasidium torrendii FP15055 ss-10]
MAQDDPQSVFRTLCPSILDTLFNLEAVPPEADCRTCAFRRAVEGEPKPSSLPQELFRCISCGVFLECRSCCLQRHLYTPLHTIKKWTSRQGFFSDVSLGELGLVYQMGHQGMGCHAATDSTTVTVMHSNGIHRVSIQWCECDRGEGDTCWRQAMRMGWYPGSWTRPKTFATFECLKLFRRQSVIARTNVRDFVTVLERMTDALTISVVPDRYKSFGHMVRQWAYLNRLARGGIGHTPEGIKGAEWGAVATRCWACPRPGVNLPDGWRDEPENSAFKYRLYLGLDANFRLENCMRKKAEQKVYEGLGEGLGCLVPSQHYFKHLASGITEEEACTAFAAITQRDTRMDHGLRATGIAGCSCTRHECVRPLGWADLCKGERFISMDYVFWACLLKEQLAQVFVTYDIGCQWRINLLGKRLGDIPQEIAYDDGARPSINVALPVFHSTCHEEECGSAENCRHKVGAGLTDGEGVERIWAGFNELASATKEMHQDVRFDALEDAIDHHNWSKNLGMGKSLLYDALTWELTQNAGVHLRRKREIAIVEQKKQAESFALTSESVSLEDQAAWISMINLWHEQEHLPPKSCTAVTL